MIETTTIFEQWGEGDLTNEQALEQMCNQLATLEDRLEPLDQLKQVLRGHISLVVDQMGGKAELPGFGSLAITKASVTSSYEARKVDAFVVKLSKLGHDELAHELADLKKDSSRSGSLRITRQK